MPSAQTPMISSPLKQTGEIDWIGPLKSYIRSGYGDDPERYTEECATLNRLRQDMRGAGRDSASGRDLLYRYYGQLELLDLRFPVDENHVKVQFTWFDAFTNKSTSQYSLAFEKASIIFNISAVLSCHAANQNRHEDSGLKTAYHSFQASAGMFTYINDNFLHAPSTDLSRDTVKTLIAVMLAQAQEVFLEKQIQDGKKPALLAKLASQAHNHYSAALEGVTDNVNRQIFERVWLLMTQIKLGYMGSLAQYYQAITDQEADHHGSTIARLQVAENMASEASRVATSFPTSVPPASNLGTETGNVLKETLKRHLTAVQEKLASAIKDNDFIYHQQVPSESGLGVVAKLPAAKAIPVTELYQGQDIQRIIGPDIFQKIVPMAVTESASVYDEEKAKLIRSENEKVEQADGEMDASLDYLKLPGSLSVLKGGMEQEITVDEEFRGWCEELAGHGGFSKTFERLQGDQATILSTLDSCTKQLDMEENICEKMRVKYGSDWTQHPSSRLNATLRSDVRSYRDAVDEASGSDVQLLSTSRMFETDFDEMRSAGETDEADVLYQSAMVKSGAKGKGTSKTEESNLLDQDYGEGGSTVAEQIQKVEEMMKKLSSIKRDRQNFLKELKERVKNDDISGTLILNKKQLASHEQQIFQQELEKFRPYQNRLLQSQHKQTSILKELTRAYGDLLQDPRVRSEQIKFETFQRQRTAVLGKYKKVFQAFTDLLAGLERAQQFYGDMRETTENLRRNVETFVNNRREEGGQLLNNIESRKQTSAAGQADKQNEALRGLMDRMALGDGSGGAGGASGQDGRSSALGARPPLQSAHSGGSAVSYPYPPSKTPTSAYSGGGGVPPSSGYPATSPAPPTTPGSYAYSPHAAQSYPTVPVPGQPPPPHQSAMQPYPQGPSPYGYQYPPTQQQQQPPQQQQPHQQPRSPPPQVNMYQQYGQHLPHGYVPPPPPPGPPPAGQQYGYVGPQGQQQQQPPPQGGHDPWAGLGQWR